LSLVCWLYSVETRPQLARLPKWRYTINACLFPRQSRRCKVFSRVYHIQIIQPDVNVYRVSSIFSLKPSLFTVRKDSPKFIVKAPLLPLVCLLFFTACCFDSQWYYGEIVQKIYLEYLYFSAEFSVACFKLLPLDACHLNCVNVVLQ